MYNQFLGTQPEVPFTATGNTTATTPNIWDSIKMNAGKINPMSVASILGMMASAVQPNSGGGRVGAGVQQMANSQLMSQALLEREKGQRDFLSKLLEKYGKSSEATDKALSFTPGQIGPISGGFANSDGTFK